MEIKGSCVCGAVRFVITGAPEVMGVCHCSRCRKSGASTMLFVKREQFRLISGSAHIATLTPEAPFTYRRSFCGRCGASLGEPLSPEASFPINAECLDEDPGVRISFEEFTAERPKWRDQPTHS